MSAWTCRIRPFRDRPDVEIPWLFYPVPPLAPAGHPTVFTDRFWDERERWESLGIGVVWGSLKPYFGPVPEPTVGTIVGTPDEWANGLSYEKYLAGVYQDPVGCFDVGPHAGEDVQPPWIFTRAVIIDGWTTGD